MIRRLLRPFSYAVVLALRPIKTFAWRTKLGFLKRLILVLTKPIDFLLILVNVQNETMLIHQRVWRGNFAFGDGIMVTDWARTAEDIVKPAFRCNDFMGVNIVASEPDAFASNSGILSHSPPLRAHTRKLLDERVFTDWVHSYEYETVRDECGEIIRDWQSDPAMARMTVIRSAATRIFVRLLCGKTLSESVAKSVTWNYLRRFAEPSLFGRYFRFVGELLGTRKFIRKDAYFVLRDLGVDTMVSDVTLFAAMFSVGTLTIDCVDRARRHGIDWASLSRQEKRNFVTEAVRLGPTVTSVHRIVERDELVRLGRRDLKLTAGDQIVYPFVCANRDKAHFPQPGRFKLDRSDEEYDKVLSWSRGPHACPAKELSILVTMAMVDALSEKHDLARLRIFNPMF